MLTGRGALGSTCRAALAGVVGILVVGTSVVAWAQNSDIGRGSGAQDGRARSVRLGDVSVTVQSHSASGTVSASGADDRFVWLPHIDPPRCGGQHDEHAISDPSRDPGPRPRDDRKCFPR